MSEAETERYTKVALVTGGARRIGRALCEQLHLAGYRVVVHYNRSQQPAQEIVHEFNQAHPSSAYAIKANLNESNEVENLAEQTLSKFGRVDVLINNASSFYPTPVASATDAQWHDLFNSNTKAPYFLAQALHPALKQNRGCIINLVDIYSARPMPNHSIYSMAKAANKMMVMSLALEFAPEVRVNGIAPGAILWPEAENGGPLINPEKIANIPLNTLGGTAAITQAALYLIEAAPYTTGHILVVDGGKSITS